MRIMNIEVTGAKSIGAIVALIDGNTDATLEAYAELLGENPTFSDWEEARKAWREGYAGQREEVSANTLDKAWTRFAADLNTAYGLIKPKSTSDASVKKTDSKKSTEEKTIKALESVGLTKDATLADLKTAADKALDTGDANLFKLFTGEMNRKVTAQRAQEEATRREQAKKDKATAGAILARLNVKLKSYSIEELVALELVLNATTPSQLLESGKSSNAA